MRKDEAVNSAVSGEREDALRIALLVLALALGVLGSYALGAATIYAELACAARAGTWIPIHDPTGAWGVCLEP